MTNASHQEDAAAGADAVTFDTSVPNPARMWNYWVGGKDNYAADRAAAEAGFQTYNERSTVRLTPRSREQIGRLLQGLEPVGGGVVPLSQWFGPGDLDGASADLAGYCGLVRKP